MNKLLLIIAACFFIAGNAFSQTPIVIVENIVNSQTIYYNHASNIARSSNDDLVALYVTTKTAGGQVAFSKFDEAFSTWSAGVEISSGFQAHKAAITNDENGNLFAAWQQKDEDGGKWLIYSSKYDGSWSTPVKVSADNDDNNEEVGIVVSSTGRLLAAWNTGDEWVLCSFSDDQGQNWSVPDTLSSEDGVIGGGSPTSGRPYLASGSTGRVIAAWHEQPDGHPDRETHVNQYDGSAWGGEQLVGQLDDSVHTYQPAVVLDSEDNIIAVLNNGTPNQALVMKKKAWADANWPAVSDTVVRLGLSANKPFVVIDDNDNLYVTFRRDMPNDETGLEDIGYVTSGDGGANWTESESINTPGLDAGYVTMATNVGTGGVDILFRESQLGTDDGDTLDVVYVRKDLITALGDDHNIVAEKFDLNQNYPNPFNPTTLIKYNVSTVGDYELEVFDVLGKKVNTLISKHHTVGVHSVRWNGTNSNGKKVVSGIYYYKLTGNNAAITKKMVLLK